MYKVLLTFHLLVLGLMVSGQQNKAIIVFEGERYDNARTYICQLKKGDPYRLNDYLQSGTSDPIDDKEIEKQFAPKAYAPRKDRNETRYISEMYEVNEKKLKKGKQRKKYFEEKEKAFLEKRQMLPTKKKSSKNISAFLPPKKQKTRIGEQFKFRERRIKKGQKRNYTSGSVNLIIKYKVKEDNKVKSYVTSCQSYLEPGKTYLLKYYGNETRRKYFLEPIPGH